MDFMDCDVLVMGGGVAGVAAAVAAARTHAKTMLVESKTFVGGNGTTGLCLHNFTTKNGKQVVYGLAQEVVDRLVAMGGAVGHVPFKGFVNTVTPVDGELFRIACTQLLDEAGVIVLYGTNVVGTQVDNGFITGVQVAVKNSLRTIRAKMYVDASGDADVAVSAGARYRKGNEKNGKMQPISMLLRAYGTDNIKIVDTLSSVEPAMASKSGVPHKIPVYFNGTFGKWNNIIREQGIFPNDDHKVFFNTVWPNQLNVNTSAVMGIDGTDPLALSRATVQLTQQVYKIAEFLKQYVPGFENAYFIPAVFAGVRETRSIQGIYEISDDDVKSGKKFSDTIGEVCFPVDIHNPDTGQAEFHPIGADGAFDIPFRSLIPSNLENVVMAGRCISASSFAYGATRNMAPCLVTGESAGVAAAMSSSKGICIPELDVKELQATLRERRVYLGE
ncbi:FAD-dependent oxidoreductase [Alicyclobacillus tolerans]|uniref:FAD-dependent oxidoreductase n=1 Tax=Alicyclobacillus tolerans TaxID=90970 RepID=UPI001F3D64D5|nr:FAD-dependent oxidoreductase [Alicyclobacillus tolerans]MCF8565602.1 FAD-dependent oxidoreductase [Alicyclobacillus tolerans]